MISTWLTYPGDATLRFPFPCTTRAMHAFRRVLYLQQPTYLDNADVVAVLRIADFLLMDELKGAAIAVIANRLSVFSFREEEWDELVDLAVCIKADPLHLLTT